MGSATEHSLQPALTCTRFAHLHRPFGASEQIEPAQSGKSSFEDGECRGVRSARSYALPPRGITRAVRLFEGKSGVEKILKPICTPIAMKPQVDPGAGDCRSPYTSKIRPPRQAMLDCWTTEQALARNLFGTPG
jgi:hypothetical protein